MGKFSYENIKNVQKVVGKKNLSLLKTPGKEKAHQIFCYVNKDGTKKFRKEVIHPQLRLGIPCYDLSFITDLYLPYQMTWFDSYRLCCLDGRCVQDPRTHSPRHADPRLLPIPTSCRRIAACNLN